MGEQQIVEVDEEFRVVQVHPPFEMQDRWVIETRDAQDPDGTWGRFYKTERYFRTAKEAQARIAGMKQRGEI